MIERECTMSEAKTRYYTILKLLKEHHALFQQVIPLIASENIPSPAVREALATDFGNRYAEGWPGERVYAGCSYIDEVELTCIDLAKKLFNAEFVDVRPISGVVANLVVYTAFAQPNDLMFALSIPCGGHISMGKGRLGGTAGAVRGLRVEYFPYDYDELTIDVDKTKKKIRDLANQNNKPKLAMFGGSVLPFPHPVKELEESLHNLGAKINYDAAHVSGLIAGKTFQDPLREGVDSVTMSTHKTFPGPQHGMVLSWNRYADQIKRATFPGLVSNHHLQHVAGVALTLAEMLEFGEAYAQQIIKNAKALGQALYERGFTVLGEKKGFTESHVVWVDVWEHGDGGKIEKELEKAHIIVNRNLLPLDIRKGRHYQHPSGIRLGTQEVTRLGMREEEMTVIADFLKRVVIDTESPTSVKKDVNSFRKDYQTPHFCFENATQAYKYVKIR
jgi:glycine hydroxymethyltransferase